MKYFWSLIKNYSKTVGERTEVDQITTVAIILQRMFGQQILDPEWTWKKYFLHQLLNLLLFIYVFFGTLECLNTTTDAELVAEASYTLIMIIIFPIKMILFINNRYLFRALYVSAKTTLIRVIESDASQDIKTVLKTGSKIVYVLFLMVLVPCSIYELSTLWYYIHGEKVLLSRSTLTLMPMISPYFEVAWFLHSIFLFEISSTIILDMWFVLLIYFLCIAFNSLGQLLVVPFREGESKVCYANRLNESLRLFYKIHVKQMAYLNRLSNMYKWLAFVPLCNAAMCTCLILLLMSKDFHAPMRRIEVKKYLVPWFTADIKSVKKQRNSGNSPPMKIMPPARSCPPQMWIFSFKKLWEMNWRFAPHLLPMFAEIFAYNWFGEQIKSKANYLHRALIDFDWTNLDMKDKKNYFIIITYMKRQFGIKTAIGNDLSLITMTAVLKVSYQAFTVLQTMDK